MGLSSRRWLNHLTHSSVAYSTASKLRHGAPDIVGERGQTELGTDLLQPTHQEGALVHRLLDRAERVFDRGAADDENVWPLFEALGHALDEVFLLPAVDAPPASRGA